MNLLRKLTGGKKPPKEETRLCYNCDNFYAEYIVKPDFTTLRGTPVPEMTCRDYCTVHKVSLPNTINDKEQTVINVANCKQWEKLENGKLPI